MFSWRYDLRHPVSSTSAETRWTVVWVRNSQQLFRFRDFFGLTDRNSRRRHLYTSSDPSSASIAECVDDWTATKVFGQRISSPGVHRESHEKLPPFVRNSAICPLGANHDPEPFISGESTPAGIQRQAYLSAWWQRLTSLWWTREAPISKWACKRFGELAPIVFSRIHWQMWLTLHHRSFSTMLGFQSGRGVCRVPKFCSMLRRMYIAS